MKYLNAIFFICVVCVFTLRAQTTADRGPVLMDTGLDKQHADLQLTTSIINQRYCRDGRLIFMLRYDFRNMKGETILLDKRSSIVPGYGISHNAQQAVEGKYKVAVHYLLGIDGKLMTLDLIPDISQFVTLKAGDSYSAAHEFIVLPDRKLTAGSYVLQFSLLTWHYPAESNIEWREKWHDKGYLWTNALTSRPMPFVINRQSEFVQCP